MKGRTKGRGRLDVVVAVAEKREEREHRRVRRKRRNKVREGRKKQMEGGGIEKGTGWSNRQTSYSNFVLSSLSTLINN